MWLLTWTIAIPVGIHALLPISIPAWGRMWGVALLVYAGCKQVMWWGRNRRYTSWQDRLAWWMGWPGMNIDSFLQPIDHERVPRPAWSEWLFAVSKLLLGAVLLWFITPLVASWPAYWVGWVGMIGLVLMLHFGLFHILSCAWRSRGVVAPPLMNWPIVAHSVGDYWGNRWNRAFRDLATKNIFRPVMRRHGAVWATLAVFLFSGLIHELVVSVPAGGGWGLPTLYFLIQGLAHLVEHSATGRCWGLEGGWRGRLFAWAVVVLPSPLLFHPPFVEGVIVPFLRVLGVLPVVQVG